MQGTGRLSGFPGVESYRLKEVTNMLMSGGGLEGFLRHVNLCLPGLHSSPPSLGVPFVWGSLP